MDYVVLDRFVAPPANRSFFTEQLAYLPDCFMPHDSTQTIASHPLSRNDHALPEKGFVFCCFNNHYKINPPVFNVWMRLLQKIPGSVLWLSGANTTVQDNLRKEAQARGIDGDRLVFAKRLDRMEDHLARYRLADLFIDTSPYNAHATAMDALWAGLPVLTCAGQSFASRVAGSLLTTLGLPELITYTHADYEQLALALATQPERLKALRAKLAAYRKTSALFDTPRFTAGLEAVYERMQAHHLAGLTPETFTH
jgi:predicted O-linked N-acetylglucosamine transferase (SPINDLY family)